MKSTKTNTKKVQSIDWKGIVKETLLLDDKKKEIERSEQSLSLRHAGILAGKMKEKGATLATAKTWWIPQIKKAAGTQWEKREATLRSGLARACVFVPYLESGLEFSEAPTSDQCLLIKNHIGLPTDEIRGNDFKMAYEKLEKKVKPKIVKKLAKELGGVSEVGEIDQSFIWDEIKTEVSKPRETGSALDRAKTAWSAFAEKYGKLDKEGRALFAQWKESTKKVS
tara:strand:- start:173 stop:847 length:675 start_codon:yes stop_codon:yes gene_type:complete